MDVNIRLTENILNWQGSQTHLPKDEGLFSLSSLRNVEFPKKFLNWVDHTLNSQENLVPFPVKNSSEPSQGVIVWVKEKETKELQINYHQSDHHIESHKIRNFFFLEKGSSLNWMEHFANSSFQTENYVFVEEGAVFNQLTVNQSRSSSKVYCDLQEKSSFFSLDINLGSWSKCVQIYGRKPGNVSVVRGLNFLKQKDQSSWFVLNQHDGVSGHSRQWYRSILSDRSRNSIHSKVSIQAQETDSHQLLQDLILSPYAKTENKPELEVAKDQVKATHGATTGTPNPMEIFYMNTRGISKEKALEFLITGWAECILSESGYDSFNGFLKKIAPILQPLVKKQVQQFHLTY
ncbi:MAG: SufD family Fe-S cluster assembly protein [Bdellovibrionales bacterium]|nr:SufD family Fe-S cluster assembly protein [Bdellovibrionales bacterium]